MLGITGVVTCIQPSKEQLMSRKLKICNIKTYNEAFKVSSVGADFMGLHYITEKDRIRIREYRRIVASHRQDSLTAMPVLVTKERNPRRLVDLIHDIEFPAVQLHYPDAEKTIEYLRSEFKDNLIIFHVCTPEDFSVVAAADYTIIDTSYIGGTGHSFNINEWLSKHGNLPSDKIMIAGGLTAELVRKYKDHKVITGFDMQSFMRDNTNRLHTRHLYQVANTLEKPHSRQNYSIGYAPTHNDQYHINGEYDFLHIDLFSKKYRKDFTYLQAIEWLSGCNNINTHDYHILLDTKRSIDKVNNFLDHYNVPLVQRFYHINRETAALYDDTLNALPAIAIDVKDVLNDDLEFDKVIANKKHIVLSLQSEKHPQRSENARLASIIIKNSVPDATIIFDRGVDHNLLFGLNIPDYSIVSGSYLRKTNAYNRLKRIMAYERI